LQDDAGEPRGDDKRHDGQDEAEEHAAIVAAARNAEEPEALLLYGCTDVTHPARYDRQNMTERGVVLARGLGTRMRQGAPGARLDAAQAAAADEGLKAFIPIGRPFLDYILSALADAGLTRLCVVIGPEHDVVRRYYASEVTLTRISVDCVIQERPLGTADAVLAAEAWTGGEPFLVVNGDNYYPIEALSALAALTLPGLVAFSREGLLADGQIAPERILSFALIDLDGLRLRRIVEKPDSVDVARLSRGSYVSMNCWRFDARIFDACRRVPLSPRGELELPLTVQQAIDDGRFPVEAVLSNAGVLDLSGRADIAAVAARLSGVEVRL
jgi:dTDP-glucose pyrophosphorylase